MTSDPAGPFEETALLLGAARQGLLDEIGPLVTGDKRYPFLMVANALAIAARRLEAGDRPEREALARLLALYEEPAPAAAEDNLHTRLDALERRLVSEIRASTYDSGPRREQVRVHLEARALDAVRISNPRYLES